MELPLRIVAKEQHLEPEAKEQHPEPEAKEKHTEPEAKEQQPVPEAKEQQPVAREGAKKVPALEHGRSGPGIGEWAQWGPRRSGGLCRGRVPVIGCAVDPVDGNGSREGSVEIEMLRCCTGVQWRTRAGNRGLFSESKPERSTT
ncbi:hypothetical protein NDU88_006878 [Pleurodeles waltl]|uniref:Uncharacterized protein n=1 Tax=Pleurodeles waltl TaxID=8319 RepID=A0AAV7MF67_PLEWA|nr:hypothetical protein NDU88_006878 [Pleurodeles waltl]